jgi:hypothetical protein
LRVFKNDGNERGDGQPGTNAMILNTYAEKFGENTGVFGSNCYYFLLKFDHYIGF